MKLRKRIQRTSISLRIVTTLVFALVVYGVFYKLQISGRELLLACILSAAVNIIYIPFHEYLHLFPLKRRGYKCQTHLSFRQFHAYMFSHDPIRLNHYRLSLVSPFIFLALIFIPVFIFISATTPFWFFSMLLSLSVCLYGSISDLWQLIQTMRCPPTSWVANTKIDTVVFDDREAALLHIESIHK